MNIRKSIIFLIVTIFIVSTVFLVPMDQSRANEMSLPRPEAPSNITNETAIDPPSTPIEENSPSDENPLTDESLTEEENSSGEDDTLENIDIDENIIDQEPSAIPSEEPVKVLETLLSNITISPNSIITGGLNSNEVMVENYDDLRTVLTGATYGNIDTIYLANDIVRTGAVIMYNSTHTVTIIGHPKGDTSVRYTLTDSSSSQLISLGPNTSLVVKDAIINSYNFYGAVYSSSSNATLEYNNVDYSGPQLAYMPYSKIRLIDSNILVAVKSGSNGLNEIAEINGVELGGNTSIRREGSITEPGFEFFGASPYLKVLPGAHVNFEDNNTNAAWSTFIYNGYIVNVDIQDNAFISIKTRTGLTYGSYYLSAVNISKNATLKVEQSQGSTISIYMGGTLNIEEGGTLEAVHNGSGEPLAFTGSSGKMTMNNPKRVKLFTASGSRLLYAGSSGEKISGTVGAINTWNGTTVPYTDAMTNTPTDIWNKNDGSLMNVNISLSGGNASAASISNLTSDDPITSPFDTNNFKVTGMRMMVMGDYSLDVDDIYENSETITGTTNPGSQIKMEYVNNGTNTLINGTVDASGGFEGIVPDSPLTLDMNVMTTTHRDYLKARHRSKVLESIGILEFVTVPESMHFPQTTIPTTNKVVSRSLASWTMTLKDTRGNGSPWKVNASINSPLTGSNGTNTYTLPNRLIYMKNGTKTPLSATPITVFSGTTASNPLLDLTWGSNEGILLDLYAGDGAPNVTYKTTINWVLIDAP